MPTTLVTCAYRVNNEGQSTADLAARMAVPPVDPATLAVTGTTINSDTTVITSPTVVTRTIVLNLTAAFKAIWPDADDQRKPFWHFMSGQLAVAVGGPVLADAPVVT